MPTTTRNSSYYVTPTRTRPAFEKILVGPIMIFGELITGGHYLEVLRLGKQMAVGRHITPSYWNLHSSFVSESGYLGAFYRGFFPWGLLECTKGLPVLFVQHETMYHLQTKAGYSHNSAERLSGFVGGATQALFVCPLQKIKVNVVACNVMNSMTPVEATNTIIKKHGLMTLYDGVIAMVLRRSLDWGIRFIVSSEVKNFLLQRRRLRGEENPMPTFYELVGCGLVGGACSTITHPIDNIVTNSQKPLPRGVPTDFVSVIRRMHKESGSKAFTRGWGIKIVDNAYHMAWMYGVGTVLYDFMRQALKSDKKI